MNMLAVRFGMSKCMAAYATVCETYATYTCVTLAFVNIYQSMSDIFCALR